MKVSPSLWPQGHSGRDQGIFLAASHSFPAISVVLLPLQVSMVILQSTMRPPTPSMCLEVSASMWSWQRLPRSSTLCIVLTAPGACSHLLRGQRLGQLAIATEGRFPKHWLSPPRFLPPVPSFQSPVLNYDNCFIFHPWFGGKNPWPGNQRHGFCPSTTLTDPLPFFSPPSMVSCNLCLISLRSPVWGNRNLSVLVGTVTCDVHTSLSPSGAEGIETKFIGNRVGCGAQGWYSRIFLMVLQNFPLEEGEDRG